MSIASSRSDIQFRTLVYIIDFSSKNQNQGGHGHEISNHISI